MSFENKIFESKKIKKMKNAKKIEIIEEFYPNFSLTVNVDGEELFSVSEDEENYDLVEKIRGRLWDYLAEIIDGRATQFFEKIHPDEEIKETEFDELVEGVYIYCKSGKVYYVEVGESWETRITGYHVSGARYDFENMRIIDATDWFADY